MALSACRFLGVKIKQYIAAHDLSIRTFAGKVSVDYIIIYRLHSGEQKSISFFDAKNILRFLEPQGYIDALSTFFPLEVKAINEHPQIEERSDEYRELVEFTFSDLDRYRIYLFASECQNATKESVVEEFGRNGIELLELLMEKRIIELRDDGTLAGTLNSVHYWPESLTKDVCRHNLVLLSLRNSGTHLRNWFFGFNEEGLQKYYEAHELFMNSLAGFMQDGTLKGNILVGSSIIMGPMNSKK